LARLSTQFGIVVRKARLLELGLDLDTVLQKLETDVAFDEDEHVLSLGPHFDEAAANELGTRLSALGLEAVDDWFIFHGDIPEWCTVSVGLT
jgi:hypothetical protein